MIPWRHMLHAQIDWLLATDDERDKPQREWVEVRPRGYFAGEYPAEASAASRAQARGAP